MEKKITDLEFIKEAFKVYLDHNLDAFSLTTIADENNIKIEDLLLQINKYIRSNNISVEEMQRYIELKNMPTYIKKPEISRSVLLGKEGYETLLHNNHNLSSLDTILNREFIGKEALMTHIRAYRKRVVEPKPTMEQELEFIDGLNRNISSYKIVYKLLDSPLDELNDAIRGYKKEELLRKIDIFKKTMPARKYAYQLDILIDKITTGPVKVVEDADGYYNSYVKKFADMIEEYLLSGYYAFKTILVKHDETTSNFIAVAKRYCPKDPKFNAIYQKYLEVSNERQDRFIIIIESILTKIENNKNYNIIDLCMDIDTTIDDFLFTLNRISKFGLVSSGYANNIINIINKYGVGNTKSLMTKEKIDSLKYSYNGVNLSKEIKEQIISFLNKYNAPITSVTIILTFEKYVRKELNLSYQL